MPDVRQFIITWTQPHRRAAFAALLKSSLLLGGLSELGWLLNTHYFSRRFPQLPISLAWSMLTMIFLVTFTQVTCSVALKFRGEKRSRLSAAMVLRLRAMLARYLSGEDCHEEIEQAAAVSPDDFETCVADALLGLRGSALHRMRELPEIAALRRKWITKSRTGDGEQRRYAVEQMGLLRDAGVIPSLELALHDSVPGVVASAVRGLLQMHFYPKRDELLRSLASRPYLVRVLTACESAGEASTQPERLERVEPVRASCSALAALGAPGRSLLRLMSAAGERGEAPAEALGASLVAAARGGGT